MKPTAFLTLLLLLGHASVFSQESQPLEAKEGNETNNLPPDPFGEIGEIEKAPDFARPVDRSRGSFSLDAKDGTYVPGSHFANWLWTMKAERWGNFYAGLVYDSMRPKLGVQLKIGDAAVLKGYAPRTNPIEENEPMVIGSVYLPKSGEYPVSLLTGDQSNVPAFNVKGILFRPAPESEPHGQSIDGLIELEAKTATTYAEALRYEPKPEKNCLGFWKHKEDWAEWVFEVSAPGTFEVTLHYGNGGGNVGNRAAVLINERTLEFDISDTGGYQQWKELKLGKVELKTQGENKLAIVPLELNGAALMDVRKVVLQPVK
ncbi:MAG: hypothetical protein B9S36_02880 [Verrucomicrobiia bacterium Tous-C2TDCM]|nr:MAG: hypothetical protein B9S36_02880 [Verrucomicrobiae bacterium Tous-C2TDCM]